jgi:retron-type reverse transcriptase
MTGRRKAPCPFSTSSHGFRPGRSAPGAALQTQHHVQVGRRSVVDVDLSKFFDRVNHDVLMVDWRSGSKTSACSG